MSILKSIVDDHGQISETDLPELEREFPEMEVVIKWAKSPRQKIQVKDVQKALDDGMESIGDYAREIFIPAQMLDFINKIKQIFS